MRLLSLLPLSALHALGTVLGWVVYGTSPTYRRHLREHLAQAGFADAALRRAAIGAAGRMIVEVPAVRGRHPIGDPAEDGSQRVQRTQRQQAEDSQDQRGEAVQDLVSLRPSTSGQDAGK